MASPVLTLALIGPIGTWELVLILGLALLIFGRRLPEVGRSMGKGIVEFRKGLKGLEDDVEQTGSTKPRSELPAGDPSAAGTRTTAESQPRTM